MLCARAAGCLASLSFVLAACGWPTTPSRPESPASVPTTSESSARPTVDHAVSLPSVGDTVVVAGEDVTITILEVVEWPAPKFLGRAAAGGRCDVQPGDEFVAVNLRVAPRTSTASVSGLGLLVGPPQGSPAHGTEDPYRAMLARWCIGPYGPWDEAEVPQPNIGATSIGSLEGTPVEGWVLFPIRPDIFDSGQAVLFYAPSVEADAIEIRLQPRASR